VNHDIYVYRELGCTVLGQIDNTGDIEHLRECAANDESAEVREAAQKAINKLDS
jgi:HEAT repeat protein